MMGDEWSSAHHRAYISEHTRENQYELKSAHLRVAMAGEVLVGSMHHAYMQSLCITCMYDMSAHVCKANVVVV